VTTSKQKIKQLAAERRRSSFRDEFYKDARRAPRASGSSKRGQNGRTVRRLPLWVTVGGLGVLFCIIAVGGSSAMIWLRQLGAMFGVYWIGD
jgi:Flp pilus assembly protein TadB